MPTCVKGAIGVGIILVLSVLVMIGRHFCTRG